MQYSLILPEVVVKSPIYSTTKPLKSFLYLLMGALQRTGHVVQKHLAGGQTLKTKDISFLNDVVSLFFFSLHGALLKWIPALVFIGMVNSMFYFPACKKRSLLNTSMKISVALVLGNFQKKNPHSKYQNFAFSACFRIC